MKYPFVLAAFTAVFLSQSAHGAEPVSFYPSKGWSVSDACLISTVYNNGYVVGLSKEGVLTIDFRQAVFTAGQSYPVALDVGSKSYNVQGNAQSADVLALDLAPHAGLKDSLGYNASFTSNIEGNVFRFFTTGLSGQLPSLNSCGGGAAVDTAVVADAQAPVAVTDVVPAADVTGENITPALAASSAEPVPRVAQVPDVMPPLREGNQRGVATLADMNRVEASQPISAATATPSNANTRIAARDSQPLPLPAPIDDLTAEPEFLPDPAPAFASSSSLPPIAEKPSAVTPTADVSRYTDQISVLTQKISTLQKENESLKSAPASKSSFRASEASLETPDWNLEKATMRFQEAERQLKDLGQKLQRERTQCQMEKKELETMLFDPQITQERQIAELAALEDENAKLQDELVNQRMRYEERIRALEAQIGGR